MSGDLLRHFALPRRVPAAPDLASRAIVGLALAGAVAAIIGLPRIFA